MLLDCYMRNFSGPHGPTPLPRLKHQCDLGLCWLSDRDLEGMIFLFTNTCDRGLETVGWTRRWIAEHGDEPFKE